MPTALLQTLIPGMEENNAPKYNPKQDFLQTGLFHQLDCWWAEVSPCSHAAGRQEGG